MTGRRTRCPWSEIAAAVASAGLALAAWAADPSVPAQPARQGRSVAEAVGLQRAAKHEFQRLVQTMVQVAETLKTTDTETARTVAAAAAKAQQALIADDMAKVIEYLEDGLVVPADATQGQVIRKLKEVLDALRSGQTDFAEQLKRLAEWRRLLDSLETVIRRQEDLERQSRDAAFGNDLLEAVEDAARRVADLVRRQREIIAATEAMPEECDPAHAERLADRQNEVKALADEVAAAVEKAIAAAPAGAPDATRPVAPSADNNVARASQHMAQAADSLRSQQKAAALVQENDALDALQRQARQLADRTDEIRKNLADPNLAGQAERQSALASDTSALAKAMEQPAGSTDGSATDPSQGGASAAPGHQSVAQAVPHQQQAGGQLGRQQPAEANREQREALRCLQAGRDALADALKREAAAAQQEAIARIETMLRAILAGQKRISADTRTVHGRQKPDGQYDRPEKVKLADLAAGEGKLAEQTDKVIRLLQQEATTLVFPEVLKEVRADMAAAEQRLADLDAGPTVQAAQKEIEDRLQEMIEALQQELARRQEDQDAQGGGNGGGEQPLVPPLAELKMLRTLQSHVNRRTAALDEAKRAVAPPPAETMDVQHRILADRQRAVGRMTCRMGQQYAGPLPAIADMMDKVATRLDESDTATETQQIERQVLAMLDDLIASAEHGQGQGQGQDQGQGQGQGLGQGRGRGPPQGTGQPSSPATTSRLSGGETVRPHDLGSLRPSDGTDDWGRLKPRERQALLDLLQQVYPHRYREMLEAYYKGISQTESRRQGQP